MEVSLVEIRIAAIFSGKPGRFDDWRQAIGDGVGVPVQYVARTRRVDLKAIFPKAQAPDRLVFIEAETRDPRWAARLTSSVRRGDWDEPPDDPLWIPLLATVPGAVLRARHLAPIGERLSELVELIYALDDGRWGLNDVGRMNEGFVRAFCAAAARGEDLTIEGGYEPSGWWTGLSPLLPTE